MQANGRPQPAHSKPIVPEARWRSLELAIRDLQASFGDHYPRAAEFLQRLTALQKEQDRQIDVTRPFEALHDEALTTNPLLDFQRLLVVQRGAGNLGLPANYFGNSSLPPTGYDNRIAVLSPVRPEGKLQTVYQPTDGRFAGDVDLDFNARRLVFSMPGSHGRWRVFEINADGTALSELPLINDPDVDDYDACYLPDGRIIFSSTACFAGIPCVNGVGHVANLFSWQRSGRIRQLTVEQDHDWCPTVLNNGRVMYLRWEYTDIPHAFSRILFHMNPDGTQQAEYYGSNSYWPAAMFYARPIPGHPTKVIAVVSGHHEVPRMGELVIFDPARGRREATGAVQRIPGRGRKVEPAALDLPIAQSWPKFLHPYPLSDKYFLVSAKPTQDSLWGIYLVDVFDNLLLLHQQPGYAMLEPIPLRETPRPPVVPERADPARKDAVVLVADIYRGDGLKGVPRGAIKSLRVIGYHFAYEGMGAEPYAVGLDGPWDPKRVLGTVPVFEDGSAAFRVPASTPIALQPLDAEGKAVQLMRSWFTAMPGEVVSCVGCHESQNTAPPSQKTTAGGRPPVDIQPWRGPPRGFSFHREVQPVLDRHCTRCHNGQPRADGAVVASLLDGDPVPVQQNKNRHNLSARFPPSYYPLRRFVRVPGKEPDMHLLNPWEYHADTTRLVQLLQKGHYDVRLDAEAWDRLITWIDLNAPAHGNWTDIRGDELAEHLRQQGSRRQQMRKLYASVDDPPEPATAPMAVNRVTPTAFAASTEPARRAVTSDGANSSPATALPATPATASPEFRTLPFPLAPGIAMELVRIPQGVFVMGQEDGCADERPTCRVTVEKPFWIGRCEVTNEQFNLFDATHDSRWENNDFLKFGPASSAGRWPGPNSRSCECPGIRPRPSAGGSRRRPAGGLCSLPRCSGNTPAERAPRRLSGMGPWSMTSRHLQTSPTLATRRSTLSAMPPART